MANNEPFLPIQLIYLAIFPILYEFYYKNLKTPEPTNVDLTFIYQFRSNIYTIDLSKCVFIIAYFGQEKISNTGQFCKYLNALTKTVPGATVVFAVSTFTNVDPQLLSYNLHINIEKYGNETKSDLSTKYPNACNYYYNALRYSFYADYFESHPEVEFAIFSDVDTLILKNPFELLRKNPEEVHFMYDYKPFYRKSDNNYKWMQAWIAHDNNIKKSCGIHILNESLDSKNILHKIPWNAGLMMGKTKNLLPICKLISHAYFCVGMFPNNAEQGILNYLMLSGQIFKLGVKFNGHYSTIGAFMSCPHSVNYNVFSNRIRSGQVYGIHHYQLLKSSYVSACYPELIGFINYNGQK